MKSFGMRYVRLFGLALMAFCGAAQAQLYGANPFDNLADPLAARGLFYLDVNTGAIVDGRLITVPARTVTGANSVVVDPTTGVYYAIVKASAVAGRLLVTLDVATGQGVEIGNLGDNFSSLTFNAAGQLYGVTGDGATVPETLYAIDKATAAITLLTALGNGADGEVIAFNPNDGLLYHWSGNGTVVFESVDPNPPHTVTPIFSGVATGEVFGAVWDGCRQVFLTHNISSAMESWSTAGVRSDLQPGTLTDVRGMALVGGLGCDVDLSLQLAVSDPAPAPGSPVTIDIDVTNSGPARARANVVTITLSPELTFVSSTGCVEDPNGVPTCTLPELFAGDTHNVQIAAVYTSGTGRVTASVATTSTDIDLANNAATLLVGPIATVTPTSGLVTTEAGGTAGFTVVLNAQPTAPETFIPVSSSDPTEGVADTAMLTFTNANWNVPQLVTVTGIDDPVIDGDVAYTLVLGPAQSADAGFDGLEVDDVAALNTDNDVAGVTVAPTAGLQTTEAGGTAMFGVVLTAQPSADVSIGVSSSDPGEGTVSTATLLFTSANWNVEQFVTVTGVDDPLVDGGIAYTVILAPTVSADPNFNGIDPADVALVNLDNDVAGVTVAPTTGLQTTEAGGTAMFGVVLTAQPSADVNIGVSSGDASEGSVSTATLVFTSANWNIEQFVTVTGVDDVQADGGIAYTVILAPAVSADPAYAGIDPTDVALVNLDDDTAGIVVAPTAGLQTTEAGGTAMFGVVLTTQPSANVSIGVSSSDPGEGSVSTATLVFTSANWNVQQFVTVTGVDDAQVDGGIAYTVILAPPVSADLAYAGIDPADVALVNLDNDTAGILVNPTAGLVVTEDGGTATFTVVLTSQPLADVSLTLSSSDPGEGTVSPTTLLFTAANWNTPQTVTITGITDAEQDGDVAFTIIIGAATSTDPAYAGQDPADVGVINLNTTIAIPTFSTPRQIPGPGVPMLLLLAGTLGWFARRGIAQRAAQSG